MLMFYVGILIGEIQIYTTKLLGTCSLFISNVIYIMLHFRK